MNKYIKKIAAVVAVAGIALSTAACSNGGKTVASYKGGKITQDDYYKEMKKSQAGQTALANMIINHVLDEQYGNKVPKNKVNKQFNNYKKQYGSQFSAVLQQNGMTEDGFKDNLKTTLLSEAALKDIKKISKSQEQKAWKSYQPKVTVQHILVSKKSKAQDIINQLDNGKSFKSLAKKYSLDPGTKDKAGKLPAFDSTDSSLDPAFKNAAFKLKTGQTTSSPVKSQSGYHVIRMIKHPAKGSFASHKKEIDNEIYQSMSQDQETMHDVIAKVLKKADVSIKDDDLKNVLSSYIPKAKDKK
ncbi:peptidylprolyl isomerase [Lactobacillus sp. ESL0684]|uniref:peptidylprolyl isomerase PrsA n=1 Tax=Lactobacillus sp. ESL0684 TaxID=2983213 RepID=UPI0023FA2093|nr:peptidylprolyl isomerase PrsA [Lactobacillus sp. ESL0684]WEV44214.1 peptidylprolyl isomerase [Lactobacillus sp. ESL0684]